MMQNITGYQCTGIQAKVGIGSESLESILKKHGFKEEIDLLSIDIDGEDYYVFESLTSIRPRLIICEFNPTIPAHIDCYQRYGTHGFGCSVAALNRVAESKGYKLVSILGVNCFFVRAEDFPKFSAYETDLQQLRIDKSLRYIITSYGGEYRVIEEKGDFYSGKINYGIGKKYPDLLHGNFIESNINIQN